VIYSQSLGAAVNKDWSRRFPPAKKVHSELQELIPGLLKAILLDIWRDSRPERLCQRTNWLFSIDMAFHYHPDKPHIAPAGLLSLGVAQAADEDMRSSFVLWEENVLPLFALEIVSKTLGGENTTKFNIYQEIGILYYLIYAPLRKRKTKFQLYKLIDGKYVSQSNGQQPYWMPEIGLAMVPKDKYSAVVNVNGCIGMTKITPDI
jgi:Putative restriction endonuclease